MKDGVDEKVIETTSWNNEVDQMTHWDEFRLLTVKS